MRKMKPLLALLLAVLLGLSAFGCGAKETSGRQPESSGSSSESSGASSQEEPESSDAGEEAPEDVVTLQMYFLGDKAKDLDMVLEQINQRLAKEVGAVMEVNYLSFGEYSTKYPLLFASQTEMDGVFSSYWCYYASQAQKNAYMELTPEMLEEHCPITWEHTPEAAWDQTRVNGKIYMIPQLHNEFVQSMIGIRDDLRVKYEMDEIETVEDLEAYMQAVVDNESGMVPYTADGQSQSALMDAFLIAPNEWGTSSSYFQLYAGYDITEDKPEVFSILETPEYKSYIERMYKWNQAGYISKDSLSNETMTRDLFDNGKVACYFYNCGTINNMKNLMDQSLKNAGAEIGLYDLTGGVQLLPYAATGGGLSIAATSKHPDLVLKVLDLIRNDKELNYLAQRGIEGKHWDFAGEKNEDGTLNENVVVPGPDSDKYGTDWFCYSAWRNWDYQTVPSKEASVKGYREMLDDLNTRKQFNVLQSFVFDDSEYKNELAALSNVVSQYGLPLEFGFVDPETGLQEFVDKMKAAGYDDVLAAYQAQAKEYANS